METKISNVTTKMNVEDVVNGYVFKGTAEVYNNSKTIKCLSAVITKEGTVTSSDPARTAGTAGGQYRYAVSRGVTDGAGAGGMMLPDNEEGEAMLVAGIAFEKALETVILAMEFNNI